jgi:isoleucyl-tRNA synthetase
VRHARDSFEKYNLMAFCLEVEKFVDGKLSNWYIRRNRRRFWRSEKGEDKQAAYQTLYTVMLTLSKLMAPIMPFLAEAMYRNLKPNVPEDSPEWPPSVHLCRYPEVDPSLQDESLSTDMDALLELVSLGSAARNSVKLKVRQPLAEMKVLPGGEEYRRAVERFGDQIREELNVKRVSLRDPASGPLLTIEVKPNMKTLGPKFGASLKQVQAALAAAEPPAVAKQVEERKPIELPGEGGPFTLAPEDVIVQRRAPEGWAGVSDRGTEVIVDTRITDELAKEGVARDVVRYVQDLRRKANLEMDDRITLYLGSESEKLLAAIAAHRDYIAAETLTVHMADAPLGGDAHSADVKIDGQALKISLRRAAA